MSRNSETGKLYAGCAGGGGGGGCCWAGCWRLRGWEDESEWLLTWETHRERKRPGGAINKDTLRSITITLHTHSPGNTT